MNWTLVRILCLIAALPRKEPSCSAFVFSKALVKQEGFQNRWRERLPGAFLRRPIYVSDASETYTHTNSAISGDGRTPPGFRSGFVSIIGNPNVGKSTILNRILDQNLCICSPKPQTTRHRILGVKTTQQYQIVFSDTPGAIQDPAYALQEAMIKSTHKAVNDCDLILLMSDVFGESLYDQKLFERILASPIPKLVVVNKGDLFQGDKFQWKLEEPTKITTSNTSSPHLIEDIMRFKEYVSGGEATRTSGVTTKQGLTSEWKSILPDAEVLFVSAKTGLGVPDLERKIASKLPIGPKYYPDDVITDRNERFFASEIIREALMYRYKREVPYHCDVRVLSFKEEGETEEDLTEIHAEILVTRESQKAILLGHRGSALREASARAQSRLEKFLNRPVLLRLIVRVSPGWRNNRGDLLRSGYLD